MDDSVQNTAISSSPAGVRTGASNIGYSQVVPADVVAYLFFG